MVTAVLVNQKRQLSTKVSDDQDDKGVKQLKDKKLKKTNQKKNQLKVLSSSEQDGRSDVSTHVDKKVNRSAPL